MAKRSAGILLYRTNNTHTEFFLVHPGGPFWQKKDEGAWTIPKGEFDDAEDGLAAAQREFEEETGVKLSGKFTPLTTVKQKAGKTIHAWAAEGNLDPSTLVSNTFSLEWPPKSGKWKEYPEVDKGEWFNEQVARIKINPAQLGLIEEVLQRVIHPKV